MLPPSSKRVLACIRCSQKRVKCDRSVPCNICVKQNAVCQYRPRKARVTRDKSRQVSNTGSTENDRGSGPGVDCSKGSDDHNEPQPESTSRPEILDSENADGVLHEPQVTVFKPQLLQGQEGTKLIDNSLWSRIAEEVSGTEENAAEEAIEPTGAPDIPEYCDFSYILGYMPSNYTKEHPTPAIIRILWQAFVKNVDPIVKIIHVPSFQLALEKAITDLDHTTKAFEAFMFSMYSMAVLSMTNEECIKLFGESRRTLLAFYVNATKIALLRARFMSSTNLVVLQALTLHIFSIRHDYEPRAVWNLTGLGLRVAQIMGMFIDGSLLGLSPFETEIRRRIWWQLKRHDSRAAELCGQAKFQQFDMDGKTPKMPANVNDSDLSPSMTHAPVASIKPTEMIWNVMLAELSSFASAHKRKVKDSKAINAPGLSSEEYSAFDDIQGKDIASDEIEELMETKYLRFCDPSKPLQMLTLVGTRYATDFIRFIAHHPRRWAQQLNVSLSEKELVWNLCIQILDRMVMMQSMSRLKQFAWMVPYHIQWPVIIHILDTLRMEPNRSKAEEAWNLIEKFCDLNTDMLLAADRPIFVAIGSLYLKAYQTRMNSLPNQDSPNEKISRYITELQQRYQKARTKESKISTECRVHHKNSVESSKNSDPISKSGYPATEILNFLPALDAGNESSFWSDTADTPDKMDTGIDANCLSLSNDWLDLSDDVAIDWTQWDAWMNTCKPL